MNDSRQTFNDKKSSKLAVTSLVLGFLGCVIFGPITAIPAIIFGHKSLKRINSSPSEYSDAENRLSKAGIFLGYIGILISLSMILYFAQFYFDPNFFGKIKLF